MKERSGMTIRRREKDLPEIIADMENRLAKASKTQNPEKYLKKETRAKLEKVPKETGSFWETRKKVEEEFVGSIIEEAKKLKISLA